jgi:putative transcriptional regulator
MLASTQFRSAQTDLRDRLTSAYASGALDAGLRLLVETQAQLTPDGVQNLEHADTLVGVLFERETPASMRPGAMEAVFASIADDRHRPQPADPRRDAARRAGAVIEEILHLPNPVQDSALAAIGRGDWTFGGPGLRTLPLNLHGTGKAEIMRIEPGWRAPRHAHSAAEFTLVMTGAFEDERGRYDVGDIAVAGPGVTHRPVAAPGAVCYALAVTEGPLEFTGALGFIQKIWRH